jgi:hypothetical protein
MLIQSHWSHFNILGIWLSSFVVMFELLPNVRRVFRLIERSKKKIERKAIAQMKDGKSNERKEMRK